MKLLKTDRLVPLVTISLAVLFSIMLYADFTRQTGRSSADEVGILAYEKKIAQRRYADEVMWESIDADAKVYNCDYLRTTAGSGAIVTLTDGTSIEMDEDTLVLVCRTGQGVNIDLDRGSIAARKKPSGRTMKVATRFGSVDVQDGVMGIGVTGKGFNLNVSSGSAEVNAGGRKEKIDQGYGAAVSGDAIQKQKDFARQAAPDINRYFICPGKEMRVDFSWETDTGRPVRLQVAKDAAFTKMAGEETGDAKASLELSAGTYYWRLADGEGKTGPARVFTIVSDRPAVPLAPYQAERIPLAGKGALVRFSWEPAAAATSYTVEIARDAGFRQVAISLESDAGSIATDRLAPGSYYWRVRNRYGFSADAALYSETRQFSVVRAATMLPPEPLVPIDGGTIPDISLAAGRTLFNWRSDPAYTGYEFTIARDAGFKTIAYREETGNNFLRPLVALGKGAYLWRVRGKTPSGAFSPPSGASAFAVAAAGPPVLEAPEQDAAMYPDESAQLVFRWRGADGGQRYRFELSTDRDFTKVLRQEDIAGLSHSLPCPEPGTYFWRVRLLDAGGRSLVSGHRAFSVAKSLQTPGGASPADNETVVITSRRGMVFTWDPVEGATGYQLSVKRVVGGREKLVYTTLVETNRYQFTKTELLDAGTFTWEVTAIRRKDNEAEIRSRPGQHLFSIKPGKQLSAPELKSRVLYVK